MEAEQLIEIYHNAFLICCVVAVISLGLAGLLFFKFRIPRILAMRSGLAARRIKKERSALDEWHQWTTEPLARNSKGLVARNFRIIKSQVIVHSDEIL